jgi:hypothetical protein
MTVSYLNCVSYDITPSATIFRVSVCYHVALKHTENQGLVAYTI